MTLLRNRMSATRRDLQKIRRKHRGEIVTSLSPEEEAKRKAAKNLRRRQVYLVDKWFFGKNQAEIEAKIAEVIAGVYTPENKKLAQEKKVQILATPDLEALFTFFRTKGKKLSSEKMATGSENDRYGFYDYILRDAYDVTGKISTLYKGKDHLIIIP